jgi:hypothetical protein
MRYVGKPDPDTGCTRWVGGKNQKGYGLFHQDTEECSKGAHIVALELATGEPANGRHALHALTCPNKDCVNPEHLRWGTNAENMRDRQIAGGYTQKLTDADVVEIRRRLECGETHASIAKAFEVSRQHVGNILHGHRRAS